MKARFKNWLTTILGVLVILFGGFCVWFGKISPAWFIGFIFGGMVLFYLKDPEWLKTIVGKILPK